jgi:hypothetical protein
MSEKSWAEMGILERLGLRKPLHQKLAEELEVVKAEDRPKALVWSLPGLYGEWGEPKEVNLLEFLNIAMGDPHVRMCVDAIASAVIANGYMVHADDPGVKEQVEGLVKSRENEFIDLIKRIVTSLAIFDEAYLEAHENVSFPRIIAPWTIQVQRDNYGRILGYRQFVHVRVDFTPEEIIHLRANSWLDFAYAVPKIQTLYRTLMVKREAELFYYQILLRKGVPAKFFIYKGGDRATFEDFVRTVANTKPGTTLFAMGEWEMHDLGNPVSDLRIPDIIDTCVQTIISIFGVPRILLGYTEAATLETSRNQIVVFQQRVRDLQNIISAGLTEAFRRITKLDGFKIDLLEWTNPEQQMRMAVTKLQAGVISIDEARRELGYPEVRQDYTSIPIPPGTGQFVGLELQEALSRIQHLLEESRRMFPEKAITYPRWVETHDQIYLYYVDPNQIDLSTIRYLSIDSERGIVLAAADVKGDEPGIMRRPVFISFEKRFWTLQAAQRWYETVFPSFIMRAFEDNKAGEPGDEA